VAVKNSIMVGPLVFLLQMFVITKNIMKRPVYPSNVGQIMLRAFCVDSVPKHYRVM